MKIQYWVAATIFGNTINFSVTGEGSIPEECEQDGREKAIQINPLCRDVILQPVATIV